MGHSIGGYLPIWKTESDLESSWRTKRERSPSKSVKCSKSARWDSTGGSKSLSLVERLVAAAERLVAAAEHPVGD